MSIKISIPENVGGDLRLLPEDTYEAAIQDLFFGTSQKGFPKITVKWIVQSEYTGKHGKDYQSTVGENVLEAYSLQPNAVWKLNSLYKLVTGDRLPQGDYTEEEFTSLIKDALIGSEALLDVATDNGSGSDRSIVKNVVAKPKKSKK